VLLTKYLYLFIYTHNGDVTFQNFRSAIHKLELTCHIIRHANYLAY